MAGQTRRETSWQELEDLFAQELAQARRRALAATSLDELEAMVVQAGERLQQALLAAAVAQQEPTREQERCPACGEAMARKGPTPRQLKTSLGEVQFEWERWQCAVCGHSVFPPG